MEEVHKLLIVGLIRKIYYPEWLAKHYRGQKKKKKKNLMEYGGCA